jgi:murein DD-endopeptidase MepM/ murein hydrolase activator NlpD
MRNARVRVLILAALGFGTLTLLVWFLTARSQSLMATQDHPGGSPSVPVTPVTEASPTPEVQVSPSPVPSSSAYPEASVPNTPTPNPEGSQPAPAPAPTTPIVPATPDLTPRASGATLQIPVAGVRPDQLHDTFNEARDEGRVHDAIDIPAPCGTPVVAAADGKVVKLFYSDRGGITIYQLDQDNRTVYYYAHLNRYADGIVEGRMLIRGETIAYVGDSGNAGPGNCHLHFSISIVSDPKRHWDGININPYPLLGGK